MKAGNLEFEGVTNTKASTTTEAGLKIPEGVAPTSPVDGDIWVTSAGAFNARLNGVTVDLAGGGGGDVTKVGTPVNNQIGVWTGDGTLEGEAKVTFASDQIFTVGAGNLVGSDDSVISIRAQSTGDAELRFYQSNSIKAFIEFDDVTDGFIIDSDTSITLAANGADDINITPASGKTVIKNLEAAVPQNTQTGTTYTAVLADADKMITLDNAAAITMTIPANASVAYPIGTKLNFMQLGAGAVTVTITTDTLNVNAALTLVLNGQYATATAFKITATTWVLFGNLVAV